MASEFHNSDICCMEDLNTIHDEDVLRHMWQQTRDFGRKKEIRLRMYKLREERLKSYYVRRETNSSRNSNIVDCKSTTVTSAYAESLIDRGFMSAKTNEIRDSSVFPMLDTAARDTHRIETEIKNQDGIVGDSFLQTYSSKNSDKEQQNQRQGYSQNKKSDETRTWTLSQRMETSSVIDHEDSGRSVLSTVQQMEIPASIVENTKITTAAPVDTSEHCHQITSAASQQSMVETEATKKETNTTTSLSSYENRSKAESVFDRSSGPQETAADVYKLESDLVTANIDQRSDYDSLVDKTTTTTTTTTRTTTTSKTEVAAEATSKISLDVSATHNAFASSLRASPTPSSGGSASIRLSSSKSSIERSSPEKTPRTSPEKHIVSQRLDTKLTTSFQNRLVACGTSAFPSPPSSEKNNRPVAAMIRRRQTGSAIQDYDSADSSAIYQKTNTEHRRSSSPTIKINSRSFDDSDADMQQRFKTDTRRQSSLLRTAVTTDAVIATAVKKVANEHSRSVEQRTRGKSDRPLATTATAPKSSADKSNVAKQTAAAAAAALVDDIPTLCSAVSDKRRLPIRDTIDKNNAAQSSPSQLESLAQQQPVASMPAKSLKPHHEVRKCATSPATSNKTKVTAKVKPANSARQSTTPKRYSQSSSSDSDSDTSMSSENGDGVVIEEIVDIVDTERERALLMQKSSPHPNSFVASERENENASMTATSTSTPTTTTTPTMASTTTPNTYTPTTTHTQTGITSASRPIREQQQLCQRVDSRSIVDKKTRKEMADSRNRNSYEKEKEKEKEKKKETVKCRKIIQKEEMDGDDGSRTVPNARSAKPFNRNLNVTSKQKPQSQQQQQRKEQRKRRRQQQQQRVNLPFQSAQPTSDANAKKRSNFGERISSNTTTTTATCKRSEKYAQQTVATMAASVAMKTIKSNGYVADSSVTPRKPKLRVGGNSIAGIETASTTSRLTKTKVKTTTTDNRKNMDSERLIRQDCKDGDNVTDANVKRRRAVNDKIGVVAVAYKTKAKLTVPVLQLQRKCRPNWPVSLRKNARSFASPELKTKAIKAIESNSKIVDGDAESSRRRMVPAPTSSKSPSSDQVTRRPSAIVNTSTRPLQKKTCVRRKNVARKSETSKIEAESNVNKANHVKSDHGKSTSKKLRQRELDVRSSSPASMSQSSNRFQRAPSSQPAAAGSTTPQPPHPSRTRDVRCTTTISTANHAGRSSHTVDRKPDKYFDNISSKLNSATIDKKTKTRAESVVSSTTTTRDHRLPHRPSLLTSSSPPQPPPKQQQKRRQEEQLNVIVRMPSSSRETSPNSTIALKNENLRPTTSPVSSNSVVEEYDGNDSTDYAVKYADRVIKSDDLVALKKITIPRFEKITQLVNVEDDYARVRCDADELEDENENKDENKKEKETNENENERIEMVTLDDDHDQETTETTQHFVNSVNVAQRICQFQEDGDASIVRRRTVRDAQNVREMKIISDRVDDEQKHAYRESSEVQLTKAKHDVEPIPHHKTVSKKLSAKDYQEFVAERASSGSGPSLEKESAASYQCRNKRVETAQHPTPSPVTHESDVTTMKSNVLRETESAAAVGQADSDTMSAPSDKILTTAAMANTSPSASLKPIEITMVQIKPSKQFDHTAIIRFDSRGCSSALNSSHTTESTTAASTISALRTRFEGESKPNQVLLSAATRNIGTENSRNRNRTPLLEKCDKSNAKIEKVARLSHRVHEPQPQQIDVETSQVKCTRANQQVDNIEEICDYELLRAMLETATRYDIRSKIRARIRSIQRHDQHQRQRQFMLKTNPKMITIRSKSPSPEKCLVTRSSAPKTDALVHIIERYNGDTPVTAFSANNRDKITDSKDIAQRTTTNDFISLRHLTTTTTTTTWTNSEQVTEEKSGHLSGYKVSGRSNVEGSGSRVGSEIAKKSAQRPQPRNHPTSDSIAGASVYSTGSLIRKLSNERFEKAQRKFSDGGIVEQITPHSRITEHRVRSSTKYRRRQQDDDAPNHSQNLRYDYTPPLSNVSDLAHRNQTTSGSSINANISISTSTNNETHHDVNNETIHPSSLTASESSSRRNYDYQVKRKTGDNNKELVATVSRCEQSYTKELLISAADDACQIKTNIGSRNSDVSGRDETSQIVQPELVSKKSQSQPQFHFRRNQHHHHHATQQLVQTSEPIPPLPISLSLNSQPDYENRSSHQIDSESETAVTSVAAAETVCVRNIWRSAMATSDSDTAAKRCTAEPMQVPKASVNPAAATARMAGHEASSIAIVAAESSHSYSCPQNNNDEYVGVPLATIHPQPQTEQQSSQRGSAAGTTENLIDDSGTESGEELRSLNPHLLAEVRDALSKLENALPNLDAARRTSLIPLVNKLQSCLKVTETPPSPRSCVSGPGASLAAANTTNSVSLKNRKTRHTIGVSREELNDARKWLVVAQNAADHFDHDGEGGVITPTESPPPPPPPSLMLLSSLSQAPIKYESSLNSSSKAYKPVKFIPTPPPPPPPPSKFHGCCDNEAISVDAKNVTMLTEQHSATELLSAFGADGKELKRDGNDSEQHCFTKIRTTTTKKLLKDETATKLKSKSDSESESEYFSGQHGDFSSSEDEKRVTAMTASTAAAAAAAAASNDVSKKPTLLRFQRKINKNKRMKRANTIDVVPKPNRSIAGLAPPPGADAACCECWFSVDETVTVDQKRTAKIAPIATVGVSLVGKPAPPKLQLKTENDKKFAAFLEHTKQDESHSKTSAYNPSAAGGIQWSNRFSNIKTTFENVKTSAFLPQPQPPPRPSSLTPTFASVKSSSTSNLEPIRPAKAIATTTTQPVVVTFPSTTMLPRQSFTHAQKSPFKPVTKVAPFHTRSPPLPLSSVVQTYVKQPKSLCFNMASADHQVHAPKTYYSPSLAPADDKKNESSRQHSAVATGDAVRPKKPLTPTVYYAKNDYFLNEPSSYLHGATGQALCSPSPSSSPSSPTPTPLAAPWSCAIATATPIANTNADNADDVLIQTRVNPAQVPRSNQYSHRAEQQPVFETRTEAKTSSSPRNGSRSTEFSQQRAPVAKIMGTAQQSVATLIDSKTNYQSPRQQSTVLASTSTSTSTPTSSSTFANTSTYQKLAEKSPILQNFTKTQPKASPQKFFSSTAQSQSLLAPSSLSSMASSQPAVKKQIRILTLNECEENLPEQFFVLNQRNKFESLNAAGSGRAAGGGGGHGHRASTVTTTPIRINEKAFFKPLTAAVATVPTTARAKVSPTVIVQQSRSPPQSPVIMPSVLQKSESWHQMIMEKMKQAKPPSPIRQNIPRAKSTHNLTTMPKQYEPAFTAQDIAVKQQTVQQFLNKTKHSQSQSQLLAAATSIMSASTNNTRTDSPVKIHRLNEDFKHVDEAFDILFEEASGICTKSNRC